MTQARYLQHAVRERAKVVASVSLDFYRFREVEPLFKKRHHGFPHRYHSQEVVPSSTRSRHALRALYQSQEVVLPLTRLRLVHHAPYRRQEGYVSTGSAGEGDLFARRFQGKATLLMKSQLRLGGVELVSGKRTVSD